MTPPRHATEPAAPVRFALFVSSVAAIGGLLFGYDTAVINGANSYLTAHLGLNPTQEGLAGASAILGCIPGAMLAGAPSDRFGRKRVLFVCAFLYALSAVLSAVPRTFEEFLVARFTGGLGIGASSMICPVYIAEIAPERWRGRLGALFQLGIVTGIFVTLFINRLVQAQGDEVWNTAYGWRWMLGLEAIPAAMFIGLLLTVPESPRWLALRGRTAEARAVLERVDRPERVERELQRIRAGMTERRVPFAALFAAGCRRPLLLAMALAAFSQFSDINAIIYYSSKIFESAGAVKDAAFTSTVWVGLINLVFTVVAIALVDRLGRKPLLLVGTAVQTGALAWVGWLFHTGQSGLPLLLGVVLFIAAFAMALGPISWLFASEIFPNALRGRAMSVSALTVWVGCYIVAQTFPMLNDNPAIGPTITFWIYAAVSLVACLFVWRLIPETKNRTLEEIGLMWQSPTPRS